MEKRIDYWKDKYETAKSDFGAARKEMEANKNQYDGKLQPPKGRETQCLYNFTKELIETEIDTNVPLPRVEPCEYSEKNVILAHIIESMLRGERKKMRLEVFNDIDERNTKIYSFDPCLVDWDNTLKTHYTVGAATVKAISPMRFVPQSHIDTLDSMDYIFFDYDITKATVKRTYGVDVQDESTETETDANDDVVTIHYAFYKNDDGYIGCFAWVGDTTVIDEEHYNARQVKVCEKCGATKPVGAKQCICGGRKWKKRNLKYEELTGDIETRWGTIPAESWAKDESGEYLYKEVEVPQQGFNELTGRFEPVYEQIFDDNQAVIGEKPMTTTEMQVYLEPTKIPYYTPEGYPVIVRKNISRPGTLLGDSDCEFIRELQLSSDMVGTRMLEKAKKQGSILLKPRDLDYSPDNSEQVLNIDRIEQMQMIGIRDMTFDISQNIALINQNYAWARSSLGINDSSQGKHDASALSGTAKELQISRMLGRQESKSKMKNAFYSDLYRKIFEFMLAYADEPRRYTAESNAGDTEDVIFNRYDFLEQDEYGNWYYNDQFIFTIDESGNSSDDRNYVLKTMQEDFIGGLYGDVTNPETMYNFWRDRAEQGYPNAKRQAQRWKEKVDQMQSQQQMMTNGLQQIPGTDLASPTQQAENAVKGAVYGGLAR